MANKDKRKIYKEQEWYVKCVKDNSRCNSENIDASFKKVTKKAKKLEHRFLKMEDYIKNFEDTDCDFVLANLCDEIYDYFPSIISNIKGINKLDKHISQDEVLLAINLFIAHYLYNKLPKELLPFCLFSLLINNSDKLIKRCKYWLKDMANDEFSHRIISTYISEDKIKILTNFDTIYKIKYSFSGKDFFNYITPPDSKFYIYELIYMCIQDFFLKYDLSIISKGKIVKIKATESDENNADISYDMFELFFNHERPILTSNTKMARKFSGRQKLYYALYNYYNSYIIENLLIEFHDIELNDELLEYENLFIKYINSLSTVQGVELLGRFIKNTNVVVTEIINNIIDLREQHNSYSETLERYILVSLQILLFSNIQKGMTSQNDIITSKDDINNYIYNPFGIITKKAEKSIDDTPYQVFYEASSFHKKCIEAKAKRAYMQYKAKLAEEYINAYIL